MSSRPRRVTCSTLLTLAVALTLLAAPTDAASSLAPAEPGGDRAEAALETARDLFAGDRPQGRGTPSRATTDATLALRDLALLRADLPADQQREAADYLSRPTDPDDRFGDSYEVAEEQPRCSTVACVHYVDSTLDRVPAADGDSNGVPDYVELALSTVTDVHEQYAAAGYRAPKSDGRRGGNPLPDVYLADIGGDGLYGYCATDDDLAPGGPFNASAYCVLDNDYVREQYARNSPRENLQVTAAHEYFHAVQFGYDVAEDPWFMESTATWAEDEVYDDVDDNAQYLRSSPLSRPDLSMDQFAGTFHYGTWIFFRYLTERRFPAEAGVMPTLVRDMWRRADAAPGGRDDYSLQAISRVLDARRTSLAEEFAGFARANRSPHRTYAESRANHYPEAPLVRRATSLTRRKPATSSTVRLDHLTSVTARFVPDSSLSGRRWRLRVAVDLPARRRGSAARLTVTRRGGDQAVQRVRLDRSGAARTSVGFSAGKVRNVELTLVNAGAGFTCRRGTRFSCAGRPLDDNLDQRLAATAFRR